MSEGISRLDWISTLHALEASELQLAETLWIHLIQYEFFHNAVCYLKQQTLTKLVLINQCRLFIDEQQIIV